MPSYNFITKFFIYYMGKKRNGKLKNYLIFQRKDNQDLHIPYLVKVYLQCMLLSAFSYSLNIVYQIIKEKLHHVQFFFCPPEPIKRKNNFRGTGWDKSRTGKNTIVHLNFYEVIVSLRLNLKIFNLCEGDKMSGQMLNKWLTWVNIL